MFLDGFLTDYDDSLSSEGYIDPMGMLVIWSAFGQKIFNGRVNSISNDVRNYTLNLFNHYIIRKVISDDSVRLSSKINGIYGGKDRLNFKFACLLYLENLYTYSLIRHRNKANTGGVLGSYNAQRIWVESKENPVMRFSYEKPGMILVRQLSLGVSGRYKSPFMQIGYFDDGYHYDPQKWTEADIFIQQTPVLNKLAKVLIDHMRTLLAQNEALRGLQFSAVPSALPDAYAEAFKSSGVVGNYARNFWLGQTGLAQGAAGALLSVLDDNAVLQPAVELKPEQLLLRALDKLPADAERRKLEHIQLLEPFLAEAFLLFTLLTAKKTQPLSAVIEAWNALGRDEHRLPFLADYVRRNPDVTDVLRGTTAHTRLTRLLGLADQPDMNSQIALVMKHHGQVMQERGQTAWMTLQDDNIKVHVRPSRMPVADDWRGQTPWVNGYYFSQFQSLVAGYQGVGA
jgi:hypothetical protein